jgi:hypothetical protein
VESLLQHLRPIVANIADFRVRFVYLHFFWFIWFEQNRAGTALFHRGPPTGHNPANGEPRAYARQNQSEARRLHRKQPATDQARIRSQSHQNWGYSSRDVSQAKVLGDSESWNREHRGLMVR